MRPIDADALKEKLKELEFRCRKMLWSGADLYVEALQVAINMIDSAPTITQPLNDPLTLDELREMDGEPVWIVGANDAEIDSNGYAVVSFLYTGHPMIFWFGDDVEIEPLEENYGKTWLAYRRKPEDVET